MQSIYPTKASPLKDRVETWNQSVFRAAILPKIVRAHYINLCWFKSLQQPSSWSRRLEGGAPLLIWSLLHLSQTSDNPWSDLTYGLPSQYRLTVISTTKSREEVVFATSCRFFMLSLSASRTEDRLHDRSDERETLILVEIFFDQRKLS